MESTAKIPGWNQVAEIELVYKNTVKASNRPIVTSSESAVDLLRDGWNANTIELLETFKVLFLNRANRVIAGLELSIGGVTGTVADPRLIFATALRINACALILCHNHPSGNPTPSAADTRLTQQMKAAGSLLDIQLLDHVILTTESFFSFADQGLL